MSYKNSHPEQDPAEGSQEVIDHELARQKQAGSGEKSDQSAKTNPVKPAKQEHRPM